MIANKEVTTPQLLREGTRAVSQGLLPMEIAKGLAKVITVQMALFDRNTTIDKTP